MEFTATEPKDAAALILLNDTCDKVLWARRNPALKFLGGFHSFPGGKVDKTDAVTRVEKSDDTGTAELIACAVRETFEETGVLLVRNGERLTRGQIVSLHDDLVSGRSSFAEILDYWDLWIDASDFEPAGTWTTPEFSQLRFRTDFFAAKCPSKQIPFAAISELQEVEFVDAASALNRWAKSEVLIAPPLLAALEALSAAASPSQTPGETLISVSEKAAELANHSGSGPDYIRLNSRMTCLPLRTKTLPPATHTNCYVVGEKRFIVIDAASPHESEQEKLFKLLESFHSNGNVCEAIVVSHLHPDHIGGEKAVKAFYKNKFGLEIPIVAHSITIESLAGIVAFDGEAPVTYSLKDRFGANFDLDVLHTPGHARGHLCFYDKELGFLLTSDNVVGEGSVVIAPPEGNMIDYLDSLHAMRNLSGLRSLAGSHGSAVSNAVAKIEEYIEHRLQRESQIFELIQNGVSSSSAIVKTVYDGLDARLIPLAAKSVEAHIEKLVAEDMIGTEWLEKARRS